jgi:hypothetical protein
MAHPKPADKAALNRLPAIRGATIRIHGGWAVYFDGEILETLHTSAEAAAQELHRQELAKRYIEAIQAGVRG